MQLAFIGDNSLEGVEADSRLAAENGFAGIEYNYWGDFRKLTPDTVKQMAAIHAKYGTRAVMLGAWGFNHLATDPAQRKEAHDLLDRQIQFAQMLKAQWIVTSAGQVPDEPVGRSVNEFASVFPPLLEKVKAAGLKIAFYALHSASFLDSLTTLERVWELIPEIKLKYDPANWRGHGDDYLAIPKRYGHKIGYVHIKDQVMENGRVTFEPPAGMGEIAFPTILAYLYQHSYDGILSLEPHGDIWCWGKPEIRRKGILLGKRYLERML